LLALAGLPVGCGGPAVADLQNNVVALVVTAVSSAPEVAAVSEHAGGHVVTRAFINASSLRLLPCSEDAANITLPARGYDLLAEQLPAEEVTTAVTELCGIRIDIDPIAQNDVEGVPEDTAVYLQGTKADGTPFELRSSLSVSLLLEAASGESFGELPLLLGFDVGVWLANINPTNVAAPERLEEKTKASAAIYVDANDNQVWDADERTPVARVR